MQPGVPFQLSLPVFEGPLDLLLELIERARLDITTVSLFQVADQYLAFLRGQEDRDAVALADFVAIGAQLLLLKSRSLLPREPADRESVEPEVDDLAEALCQYRLFREAAGAFRSREMEPVRSFPRLAPATALPSTAPAPVSPDRLLLLVQQALERVRVEPVAALPVPLVSVAEKAAQILAALEHQAKVGFLTFAVTCHSRLEVVVCFIALLHLLREGDVAVVQATPFGEIEIRRTRPPVQPPGGRG